MAGSSDDHGLLSNSERICRQSQIADLSVCAPALEQSSSLLARLGQGLKDSLALAVALIDRGGCFVLVSRGACAMTGYEEIELLGRHFSSVLRPEHVPRVTAQVGRTLLRGEAIASFKTELLCKDGDERTIQFNLVPWIEDGQIAGALVLAEDATARHHVEEHLRLMESVVVHANDAIVIMEAAPRGTPGPRILYVNAAFTRMTGYTAAEAWGLTSDLLQGPESDPAAGARIRAALDRREPVREELVIYQKDGSPFWVELSLVPAADQCERHTHWISTYRDISERKHREALAQAQVAKLQREIGTTQLGLRQRHGVASITGRSHAVLALHQQIRQLADNVRLPVLIQGESGTGKELVAQAIHYESARATRPFVAVNCAALPHDLVESELFGHERGAYTGAVSSHNGYFVQADGGTIFLDEIGEIDLNVQAKLLRVLETLKVRRLGGTQDISVDVRVISASNRELKHALEAGRFREDLYYRIAGIEVLVPPLRDRGGDDIIRLTEHFLAKMSAQLKRPIPVLAPDAAAALKRYRWPGNVRELQNVVQRMLVSTREDRLTIEAVPAEVRKGITVPGSMPGPTWGTIRQALRRCRYNISAAARELGLSRHQLRRRLKAYRLKMQKA